MEEKTYKIIENPRMMTLDEIEETYDGYWVYIVKAVFDKYNDLVKGMPVVIGAGQYDGIYDGIYDKYDTDEYRERIGITWLLPFKYSIPTISM